MKGLLYLEDGTLLIGEAFGEAGTTIGELVFNTAMTGYQEVLTDPSYAGQIVCMTYPLIGNYGIDPAVSESRQAFLKGFVIKELSAITSNYTSQTDLDTFLKEQKILAIKGVDTRKLTKKIREQGSLKAVITSEDLSQTELKALADGHVMEKDLVAAVSRKEIEMIAGEAGKPHIAVVDCGIKNSILSGLTQRGCAVTIFPHSTTAEELLSHKPDGVLFSNGPGNPEDLPEMVETIRALTGKIPLFGICLGHQLLALAFGAKTYKLKYGHHGGNHGVKDLRTGNCYITSQNHEYAVDCDGMDATGLEVTLINLNDNTVEGIRHKNCPVLSVQFHPEASPGPQESGAIFDEFLSLIKK